MADDAMHFLVDEGNGVTLRDAGTALTVALPVAQITVDGFTATVAGHIEAKANIADLALRTVQTFSVAEGNATAGQTTFTVAPYTLGSVEVFLNGGFIPEGASFTAADGTKIVLSDPFQSTDRLAVVTLKIGGLLGVSEIIHNIEISQVNGLGDALSAVQAFLYLPRDPLPSDIPTGFRRTVKNTATGRISDWANDGGTMIDLLTLTPAS